MIKNEDFFSTEYAESIFLSKYAKKKKNGEKESIGEAIERVAINENKYDKNKRDEMTEKTIEYISKKWFSPAGGQWRAAGAESNKISNVNCTTSFPPEDNLESIFESLYWWAKFAAYGQGNGIDLTSIRPSGMPLHNTARTSTGAVSFMNVYDAVLKVIAQSGRRGASLISIHDTYPDFEIFCRIKDNKRNNLSTANISVQISDEFMKAVLEDKEWTLKWTSEEYPSDTIVIKRRAKELFDILVDQAWKSGDPGLQFATRMREYSNSDMYGDKYKVVSSNACSEQILDPHNTCVLASISLAHAPTDLDEFIKWLRELTFFGVRFLDNVVLNELNENRSPSPIQREKLKSMTRIGLGITGWADWLINQKVRYDSAKALELAKIVFSNFHKFSIQASNELGAERGTFEEFKWKIALESKHYRRLIEDGVITKEDIKHLRHVAVNSYAPTGSISILMEAGGTGIEPIFSKYYVRRERSTLDGQWKEWFMFNDAVRRYLTNKRVSLTKENVEQYCADEYWATAFDVDVDKKVDFLSIVQRYNDSSISTTFNLPEDATKEDVANIYIKSWQAGLKGSTIYREGSKTGVLITERNYEKMIKEGENPYKIERHYAPPRPQKLPCDIYHMTSEKQKWLVLVGKMGDDVYEVFCGKEDKILVPKKYKKGYLIKKGHRKYSLYIPVEKDDDLVFNDILSLFENEEYNILTRMISMSLRHGVPLKFVIDQLMKEKAEFTAFNKAIARVLKKYIKDGEPLDNGEVCPMCGSDQLVYQSGCVTCLKCGYSKCN